MNPAKGMYKQITFTLKEYSPTIFTSITLYTKELYMYIKGSLVTLNSCFPPPFTPKSLYTKDLLGSFRIKYILHKKTFLD